MPSPLTAEHLERIVHANADALGLRIPIDYRPGVVTYFKLAADMADLVMTLPLGPDDESGAVFTPVSPQGGS
jgi:Protein of unknown function (DUF4089)